MLAGVHNSSLRLQWVVTQSRLSFACTQGGAHLHHWSVVCTPLSPGHSFLERPEEPRPHHLLQLPSACVDSHLSATAASYMAAPSCPILAAYIQLTLALTSASAETAAHTRLVHASPSARRAIAAGSTRPCNNKAVRLAAEKEAFV